MTTTSTFQGIDPNDPKTSSKVLAPPGGKTSVNLFGGAEPEAHQPVQRGAKHADRNASNVTFQGPEPDSQRVKTVNRPGDNSASNLFGPPPVRESPKNNSTKTTHNSLFGPAEPVQAKSVQSGAANSYAGNEQAGKTSTKVMAPPGGQSQIRLG